MADATGFRREVEVPRAVLRFAGEEAFGKTIRVEYEVRDIELFQAALGLVWPRDRIRQSMKASSSRLRHSEIA